MWILLACAAGAATLLWLGILPAKSVRAVLFWYRPGRRSDRLALDGCSGWVRCAVYLRTGGRVVFSLDSRLTRGEVRAVLTDRHGACLTLDPGSPAGSLSAVRGGRYVLRWQFRRASGSCTLRWEQGADAPR